MTQFQKKGKDVVQLTRFQYRWITQSLNWLSRQQLKKKANGVSLRAPSGLEWTEGLNRLDNAAIYIVDLPADGEWKLQVPVDAGDYKYSVKVSSAENINFNHHYTKKVNGKTLEFKSPLAGKFLASRVSHFPSIL